MIVHRLLRIGIPVSTALIVAGIGLSVLLLDCLSYRLLAEPQADHWVLIDLTIATLIATPVTWVLLKLLQRSHMQQESLAAALAEVRELKGLLPLCAGCKKVRDDAGYWQQVDVYIRNHTRAEVTHSLCPACVESHYPELSRASE